jgi:two-component system, chemotaxis family, sensor kinase CheA
MSYDDGELIVSFVIETNEHLADVERKLLEIESDGAEAGSELINTVFRAIHSTKGTAGFLGLHTINALAHEIENVLNLLRNRQLRPTPRVVDLLLRSTDNLRSMVNNIEHCGEVDLSEIVKALEALATQSKTTNESDHDQESPVAEEETSVAVLPNSSHSEDLQPEQAIVIERTVSEPGLPSGGGTSAAQDITTTTAPAGGESSIRVAVGILDRLMNLAGELVLGRNQLLQVIEHCDRTGLESVGARIDQVTSELQEAIMHSRMQPIGNIFGRFSRVVRDLSQQLKKQCDLIVEGKEVELDKTIIEAIGDPLIHLIRNSLDHGLESPDQRIAKGKKAAGTIRLTASHQAGRVNITITDDGAGIDAAKIKSKAIAKGILTSEQAAALSEQDAVRLVFHAGFSTAEQVTDISGRGVGMDVVKTNIARLGGTVDIETDLGRGTTVRIKLPLTLAIIPSLIIRSAGERFAIPQGSINELVRVPAAEKDHRVVCVRDSELLRLRGKLLPLVRLTEALGFEELCEQDQKGEISTTALNIIVVEAGAIRYGLIVDGLNDSEEIVVKPLGRHLKDSPCLAGATVLGDGQVALILDISSIATHMQLVKQSETNCDNSTASDAQFDQETQKMLLFSNAPTEQFAIPMPVIKRIERIPAGQLESIGGHDLIQYRNASLPLLSLERFIKAQPRPDKAQLYVVVFETCGREVGLIVPQLVDIREVSTEIDGLTFREPGVLGSLVLENQAIRLIDLYELARSAYPDWVQEEQRATHAVQEQATILLAEDSGFFRRQVSNFLESHGHSVVACEDGQIAWDTLQDSQQTFHLVVTDIEMPNMTGFELCHRIKSHPGLSHLPVIALTSLADETSIQRGSESGVDDYQVKMDRDRLLSSVQRLLAGKSTVVGSKSTTAGREFQELLAV